MRYPRERRELLEVARQLNPLRLNQGKSGNVSVRTADGFLVTPTGVPYQAMTAEDLVDLRLDGTARPFQLAPSSEWRIHKDVYAARPEVGAVVHTHAMFATTLSCLRRGIPPFHYMVAVAGGSDVRCAEYATFGSAELSANALAALRGRRACLLANHGLLVVGETLAHALDVAIEVETLAEQYWRAIQVGEPVLLDAEEMDLVLEKFTTYGQPARRRG